LPLREVFAGTRVVELSCETSLTIITAPYDMLRDTGQIEWRQSRNDESLLKKKALGIPKVPPHRSRSQPAATHRFARSISKMSLEK